MTVKSLSGFACESGRVRREKLSLMRKIDVFSPQAWGPWDSRIRSASCKVHNQCISKVKKPWSSTVTLATAMPTVVINSREVLIVPLICHDERVYKQIILCQTSFKYQSQLLFPSQNNSTRTKLTKSNNHPSTKKNWTYGIFPFLS